MNTAVDFEIILETRGRSAGRIGDGSQVAKLDRLDDRRFDGARARA